jgi:CelD/BcsL family acetyltransferase involved in cellulose biosynthesis
LIRIQILKSAADFEAVRGSWEALSLQQGLSIFQRYSWNRLAAELFADREAPHVIVAERGTDMVILPLAIRGDGTARLLGETLFDYRDMLSTGDRALEVAAITEAAKSGCGLEITALTEEAASRWGMLPSQPFCNAPRILHSTCSAEQLMTAHRRLGRHSRRLAARGAQIRHRDGTDLAFIHELYRLKATQPGSLFADPVRREFMERICQEEGESCEIFTYETADHLVAALLTFRTSDRRHFYTVYYDMEWGHFSPGQVLLYEASLRSLEQGLDCDFMTGEYPYKMRLADHSAPLRRLKLTAAEWQAAVGARPANAAA